MKSNYEIVCHPRLHAPSALCSLLWGDQPPPQACSQEDVGANIIFISDPLCLFLSPGVHIHILILVAFMKDAAWLLWYTQVNKECIAFLHLLFPQCISTVQYLSPEFGYKYAVIDC